PGRRDIEGVMPGTSGLQQPLECAAGASQDLDVGALRRWQIGGNAHTQDGRALIRVDVKTQRSVPARKSRELVHALDDPPDDGQIPIEPPGRLADDGVETAAVTRVGWIVPR